MSTSRLLIVVSLLLTSCSALDTSTRTGTRALYSVDRAALAYPAQESEETGYRSTDTSLSAVDLLVGTRQLDEDYWMPVDQQVAFGLQGTFQQNGAEIGFEAGLLYSQETDSDNVGGFDVELDATLLELYAGIHKSFGTRASKLRPYLGAGLSVLLVTVDGTVEGMGSADDDETTFGFYAHGGLPFQLTENLRIGADARVLLGSDLSLFGADGDADYIQVGVFLGYAF